MISCLLCSKSKNELDYIASCVKKLAFLESDEKWDITLCHGADELEKKTEDQIVYNIVCIDVTLDNSIVIAEKIRENAPDTYVMLISNDSISPIEYVKPTIMPAGLMLRPLSKRSVKECIYENIRMYLKIFYGETAISSFLLDSKEGRQYIPYSQISYFESREKKIFLYTSKDQYSFYDTLENLTEKLSDDFIRCHRSFIIRKDMIEKVYLSKGYIVLIDGEMIPISRTYKPQLKELRI